MLNCIYSGFDDIINKNEAYKVKFAIDHFVENEGYLRSRQSEMPTWLYLEFPKRMETDTSITLPEPHWESWK